MGEVNLEDLYKLEKVGKITVKDAGLDEELAKSLDLSKMAKCSDVASIKASPEKFTYVVY